MTLRSLLRRRSAATAAGLVAAAIVFLTLAGTHEPPTPAQQRATVTAALNQVHAPAGWAAGRAGLNFGWDEDTITQDRHGVWTGTDPEMPQRRYAVSWQHVVTTGEEQTRCAQAADWLLTYAPKLPGDPDPGTRPLDGEPNPDRAALIHRCRVALTETGAGANVEDTYAVWQPGTVWSGYQYQAYLTFAASNDHRWLAVTVLAGQDQS